MKFTPASPDFQQKVEGSFARQKFMGHLNASLKEVRPGYCEIHIPFEENLTQQHGFFHAGVVSTIADNCSGYAAFSLMEQNSSVLTVEFKLNLMAPAQGELLVGKAQVLKNGRTLTVCRADVYVIKDGEEKLCAAAQTTLIELKNSADHGS